MERNISGISNSAGSSHDWVCHNCDTSLNIWTSNHHQTYTWHTPIYVGYFITKYHSATDVFIRGAYKTLEDAKSKIVEYANVTWTVESDHGHTLHKAVKDEWATYLIRETHLSETVPEFPSNYREEPVPDTIPEYWLEIENATREKVRAVYDDLNQYIEQVLDINRYCNRECLRKPALTMNERMIDRCARTLATKIIAKDPLPIIQLLSTSEKVFLNE